MVDARADIRNGAEVAVLRRRAKLLVAVEYFPHAIQRGTTQELHRLAQSCRTRQVNSKYQFEIDRTAYISYQSADPKKIPSFEALYLRWTIDTVLTGPRIRTGDDNTDIGVDSRYADAGDVIIDPEPSLSAADEYYTQLEFKYSHRGNGSGYKTVEFNQDGSRSVQVEQSAREGDTCLSIEANWTQYDNQADSDPGKIDFTLAMNTIRESNRRLRLPEVTFRGDRLNQLFMYCRPTVMVFIGSKFERSAPPHTGRGENRRHAHIRRDQPQKPLDA